MPLSEYNELGEEFAHEPGIGLAAGDDGLDIVVKILRDAPDYLRPGGIIVVEVGYSGEMLSNQYPEIPFLWLDFEYGGEGVFLLDYNQLIEYRPVFEAVATGRSTNSV